MLKPKIKMSSLQASAVALVQASGRPNRREPIDPCEGVGVAVGGGREGSVEGRGCALLPSPRVRLT